MAYANLLDRVREVIRQKGYSHRTEQAYVSWIRRFIIFHNERRPQEMGAREIEQFLTYLARERCVAPSTQNQALQALLFLYREVLHQPIDRRLHFPQAKQPPRPLPVVLTREEVRRVLDAMEGTPKLVAQLLYGSGLRLMEALRLRVQDVDFERGQLWVRDGKGFKDRVTVLPQSLIGPLRAQLRHTRLLFEYDRQFPHWAGATLPHALEREAPDAARSWSWQYVFPAARLVQDPRTGTWRRHHLHEAVVQRALRKAARLVGIAKRVTSHVLRHSFATHLLEAGYDVRTVQALLGHRDVKSTMVYTHVMQKDPLAVSSPLDALS